MSRDGGIACQIRGRPSALWTVVSIVGVVKLEIHFEQIKHLTQPFEFHGHKGCGCGLA